MLFLVAFIPKLAVLFPGEDVTFTCNITVGRLWLINDTTTRKLSNELPAGLSTSGTMLIVTNSANDTLYGCGFVLIAPNGTEVFLHSTGILYVAGT